MTIYIVVFDRDSFVVSSSLFADISQFIDDNYTAEHIIEKSACMGPARMSGKPARARVCMKEELIADSSTEDIGDAIKNTIDESFSQMLLRKIDEKNMTDSECYKKANIDRKLFSKIRSDAHYRPSKPTAIAFAIALELDLDETREMLMKAGFALSHSNKFDIIIEYFIKQKNYDIFQINEALFAFDQQLLGA